MKEFMDKDFLLETETARHLFHDYAAPLPLSDYHCHIPPREIFEDRRFNNLVEVWLGGTAPDGARYAMLRGGYTVYALAPATARMLFGR